MAIPTVVVTLHQPSKTAASGLKRHGLTADKSAANPGDLVALIAGEDEAAAFGAFAADHPDTLTITLNPAGGAGA